MLTRLAMLGCAVATASAAEAGSANGVPSYVTVQNNGVAVFTIQAGHANNPACSTTQRWAFTVNSATGQSMLATILNAYNLNKPMIVWGTGDCSTWGDSETVSYLVLI